MHPLAAKRCRPTLDKARDIRGAERGQVDWSGPEPFGQKLAGESQVGDQGRRGEGAFLLQIAPKGILQLLCGRGRRHRRLRNHPLPTQQIPEPLQPGPIAASRAPMPCARSQVGWEKLGGDLRCGDPTFGQPVAAASHQADLEFRRLLGVAFGVPLSRKGIDVRTQRALMQVVNSSGSSNTVMAHPSPPCEVGYSEETPNYAGRATLKQAIHGAMATPPGIVRDPE